MSARSDYLPFADPKKGHGGARPLFPDAAARERAINPAHNVVLEASAGTGKTHVLVERYLNLLRHGVDPANILAITYTRKAAAEMRERILGELRSRAAAISGDQQVWRDIRDRSAEVAISTIDAFCLSLLHEFPLEAGLDPGFEMADQTQVPRLLEEALDRALDIARNLSRTDEYVRLLFAELREWRLREGLATMIERRLIVEDALERALEHGPKNLTAEAACEQAFEKLRSIFNGLTGGVDGFLANGPLGHRRWVLFSSDMRMLANGPVPAPGLARGVLDRMESHFLNKDGEPRQRFDAYSTKDCKSPDAWRTHRKDVERLGVDVAGVLKTFRRDLNAVLSRGVRRVYQIALSEYYRTLDAHGVLDFSETLARALALLAQMDEFARSRYRLEGRYHHVLVDEFQDTSRAQWGLVALLIRSWGEGSGVAENSPLIPSIFVVGDRKQSIYGFRDADVRVMDDAGDFVDALRADSDSRRAISKSFRAVPQLLAFLNDLFRDVEKDLSRTDSFRFTEQDCFPLDAPPPADADSLGIVAAPTVTECADIVAAEIARLIKEDRVAPKDVAILFRTKDSHQQFEKALERRHIASYVYKGLGFFEADEIKDILALLRYLAAPDSHLRAAAFLRSRFVRLSDPGIQALAPDLAGALAGSDPKLGISRTLGEEDHRVLSHTREAVARWLALADRLPPAEVLEIALDETAYVFETRGPRVRQAHENLKKIRSMIRRVQNRGYLTMSRLAEHLEMLTAGDESNAVIDAGDAVSLMTIHAAKGLEFPIVFVVNLSKGTSARRSPIRVVSDSADGRAWLSVSDFQSEADQDAKAKDREETKRLLYVGLTRARSRLYLASEVKDGTFRAWGGSLGDVLPATFKSIFDIAATSTGETPARSSAIDWTAGSGQIHRLRVCPAQTSVSMAVAQGPRPVAALPDNFGPLPDPFVLSRLAVTEAVAPLNRRRQLAYEEATHNLAGTLVHRLFERRATSLGVRLKPDTTETPDATETATPGAAVPSGFSRTEIIDELRRLIRDDEVIDAEAVEQVLEDACSSYLALCGEPDLAAALATGPALFEVPFSLRPAGAQSVLRGTFDCLVRCDDGTVTILELKTGRPLPEHQRQLDIYLTAARAMFPGTPVEGKLIYARRRNLDDRKFDAKRG